ncbi:MAG: PIN domain-containing protein [Candidatus Woesebacteria bacterium]|jgi:predicted nucleic acid-binding protein
MVIFDTNIIIDHLRISGKKKSLLLQFAEKSPKESFAISMLTVQELYEGQSTRDSDKEAALLATISPLKILTYNYEIAKLAGKIARDLKRSIELADAAIAATVIMNNAELLTLNAKDFRGIKGLELVNRS